MHTISYPDHTTASLSREEIIGGSPYTLIYFYPKDNTPGCTIQAQGLASVYAQLQDIGVSLYGVSKDSIKSHCKFQDTYTLPFALVSDADLIVHSMPQHQTRIEKKMYGKTYMGSERSSFLYSRSGELIHERRSVDTKTHAQTIIDFCSCL